jgi:hypothetical protein
VLVGQQSDDHRNHEIIAAFQQLGELGLFIYGFKPVIS